MGADEPQEMSGLGSLDVSSLQGPVWVLAPHPDDEALGCGGLLAELTDLGTEVWALLISDGGASHSGSASWSRQRLAQQRLREWHCGLDLLGVHLQQRVALNLPDGHLPWPNEPGGPAAISAVCAALSRRPPATVLLPWRRDPHPDHRAAHALIRAALHTWPAARLLEYTVWLPERAGADDLPRPGEVWTWVADVRRQLGRKEAAIRAHRSQLGQLISDDPGGFVLPEVMIIRALSGQERLLEDLG
jgi:LmbE family N-acetylglucosaminyl deacetylase